MNLQKIKAILKEIEELEFENKWPTSSVKKAEDLRNKAYGWLTLEIPDKSLQYYHIQSLKFGELRGNINYTSFYIDKKKLLDTLKQLISPYEETVQSADHKDFQQRMTITQQNDLNTKLSNALKANTIELDRIKSENKILQLRLADIEKEKRFSIEKFSKALWSYIKVAGWASIFVVGIGGYWTVWDKAYNLGKDNGAAKFDNEKIELLNSNKQLKLENEKLKKKPIK